MNQIDTLLDRMRADNKLDKFKRSFIKLYTDQERVIFTLHHLSQYSDLIPSTTGVPKNAEISEGLRQIGTELLITEDLDNNTIDTWINGLKICTQSIAFAPYPSKQLALAYDKRSEVLFRLGLYSECIKDIDRALELKYLDDEEIARLYLRRTECLINLEKCSCSVEDVEDTLKEVQHCLNKMSFNDPDEKELLSELDTLHRKAVETEQSVTDNNSTRTKVKESENQYKVSSHNAESPCSLDTVAIKHNADYGRHVIAIRDIEPGEIIAVEKPYTLLLSPQNKETHCSNCLEVCLANIPCNYCTYAMYCSIKCKNDAWEKCHRVECNVFPVLIECGGDDLELLSLRLAVLALREAGNKIEKLKTMIEEFDQNNDPRIKNFDGKLQSDKYVGVYNLSTRIENREFKELFMMSWNTCIILYHLVTCKAKLFDVELPTNFSSLALIDDVTFFGDLILRHQQIIYINGHNVCDVSGLQHLQRGLALMPFVSLFNHSCFPNTFRQTRSKHIVLHAIYPIQKGQELFDTFGPYYACDERDIRKQKLKRRYLFFDCNCVACREKWHLPDQLPSYMTLVEKAEDKAEIEKALQNLYSYYYLTEKSNVDDKPYIKQELLKMIQILHNYTSIPCSEMVKVLITLNRIIAFEGNNRFKLPQIPTSQM